MALLEQVSDRNGHWITYEYDDHGTPLALTHSASYRIRISTESGRITALHLASAAPDGSDAELIRYGYTDGNLTDVVNSSSLPLRFGYDDRRRITSWTDRNGRGYRYVYDDLDRCVFQTGTEGHMRCTLEYGEPDPETGLRVTTLTDALGDTTRSVFNARSQLVSETDATGSTVVTQWDRHDRLLSRTDPPRPHDGAALRRRRQPGRGRPPRRAGEHGGVQRPGPAGDAHRPGRRDLAPDVRRGGQPHLGHGPGGRDDDVRVRRPGAPGRGDGRAGQRHARPLQRGQPPHGDHRPAGRRDQLPARRLRPRDDRHRPGRQHDPPLLDGRGQTRPSHRTGRRGGDVDVRR
ncbi:hypothetical protein GCM10020000_31100 [Streptomyces olivoverticillatus]